jgi:L-aminopeptidase/D-esterase-like protein
VLSVISVFTFAAAARKSVASIVLYRRHMRSDRWPMIAMAVVLSTPARRKAVAAQCRIS